MKRMSGKVVGPEDLPSQGGDVCEREQGTF